MGSLADQHSAMLEERKTIDEKIEKINNIISLRDQGLTSEDISFLVSSIQDFTRNYQTFCRRYDDLIWEVRDTFTQRGKKNGETLPTFGSTESIYFEPDELSDVDRTSIEIFLTERENLSTAIADREAAIARLENDLQKARERITDFELENKDLRGKLELGSQHLAVLSEKMECVMTENKTLNSEKSAIYERLQEAEESNTKLKFQGEAFEGEKERLDMKVSDLQIQSDKLRGFLKVREKELMSSAEEKSALLERIQQVEIEKSAVEGLAKDLNAEISELTIAISEVRSLNSELEMNLKKERDEVSQLQREIEDLQRNFSSERRALMDRSNILQIENDSLRAESAELQERLQMTTQGIAEANTMIKKFESNLIPRIMAQKKAVADKKVALENLSVVYKELKHEMSQKMMEELAAKAERIFQLEMIVEERKMQMMKLEENHKEALEKLKLSATEKANADKEVSKLNELVQTLEVHLRLLDRKLKITKSEFKEKEETYKKKLKELQEKCTQLEENCDAMYEEICYREKESEEVKEAIATTVAWFTDNFQKFELACEDRCGHFHQRIFECSSELGTVKGILGPLNSERRQLEYEKFEHIAKLAHLEESLRGLRDETNYLQEKLSAKDASLRMLTDETNCLQEKLFATDASLRMLRDESACLQEELSAKDASLRMLRDETDCLQEELSAKDAKEMRLVEELERRAKEREDDGRIVMELERRLKERDSEVCAKDEEKREAIRQLCALVEYHRERFDELQRSLSAKGGKIRSSA